MGGYLPPITEGLSALSSALGLLKELRDVDHTLDKAELKLRITEIAGQLGDARTALQDARDENEELEKEVNRLVKEFEFRGKLVEWRGFQYEADEEGRPFGAPFCPACIVRHQQHIRLDGRFRKTNCPLCSATYEGATPLWYPDQRQPPESGAEAE